MQSAQTILKLKYCLPYVTVGAKFAISLKRFPHSDGGQ